MTDQDRRFTQGFHLVFQVGSIIADACGAQRRRRTRAIVEAQSGCCDAIARGLEFFLQPVQRPGPAEGAMDHQHWWLLARFHCFASGRKAAMTCL